jgi:hypothetical protein
MASNISRMNRVLVAVAVGALATPILLFYAGFGDALSHRGDMIVTFFPYAAAMSSRSGTAEVILTYLQLPLYAFLLTVVRPTIWKLVVLVLIILVHVAAVAGLH